MSDIVERMNAWEARFEEEHPTVWFFCWLALLPVAGGGLWLLIDMMEASL